jgi:hypothetical protein
MKYLKLHFLSIWILKIIIIISFLFFFPSCSNKEINSPEIEFKTVNILIGPGEKAKEQPVNPVFAWHPIPGIKIYYLEVTEDSNNWQSPALSIGSISDTVYKVPKQLKDGNNYYWRISCSNDALLVYRSPVWSLSTKESVLQKMSKCSFYEIKICGPHRENDLNNTMRLTSVFVSSPDKSLYSREWKDNKYIALCSLSQDRINITIDVTISFSSNGDRIDSISLLDSYLKSELNIGIRSTYISAKIVNIPIISSDNEYLFKIQGSGTENHVKYLSHRETIINTFTYPNHQWIYTTSIWNDTSYVSFRLY